MRPYRHPAKGAILLMTVLVMGAAAFVGFLALSRVSIGRVVNANEFVRASALRAKTYGCLDEAFIWLQANSSWNQPTVTTGDATCTVTVTIPQAGQRLVKVRLSDSELQYGLDAVVTDTTIGIVSITPTLP
jgi:hypothetical protein